MAMRIGALGLATAAMVMAAMPGCASIPAPLPSVQPSPAVTKSYASRNQWRPSEPVTQVVMSQKEKLSKRNQYLADYAANIGLSDPPDIKVVEIGYPETIAPKQVRCLQRAGFRVHLRPDGAGYQADTDEEPDDDYRAAQYRCAAAYFVDPRLSLPPTRAQLRLVWEYLSDFVAPCLRLHGIQIADIPAADDFVSSGGQGWDYPRDVGADVLAECNPRVPPRLLLGDR